MKKSELLKLLKKINYKSILEGKKKGKKCKKKIIKVGKWKAVICPGGTVYKKKKLTKVQEEKGLIDDIYDLGDRFRARLGGLDKDNISVVSRKSLLTELVDLDKELKKAISKHNLTDLKGIKKDLIRLVHEIEMRYEKQSKKRK